MDGTGMTPFIGVLIAVVSVSFASIFIKWSDSPPLVIAAYRMLFASLMLAPFAMGPCRRQCVTLSKNSYLLLAGIGVVLALHFWAFNASLTLTTVAASTLLVTAHPLIIGVVSIFILKETDKRAMAGMVLGFSGIILMSVSGLEGGELAGDALAFTGCILAAIYIVGGRVMRQKVDLVPYAFFVYSFATIFLFGACLLTGEQLWPISNEDLVLFLLLAGVSTILGHTMYNWSLKYVSASLVSVSLLGEPILATIWAALFLGEIPTPLILISGAFLLVGVLIVAKYEVRIEKESPALL
jgi:drug/metabolite transporter (DMT)-like permease